MNILISTQKWYFNCKGAEDEGKQTKKVASGESSSSSYYHRTHKIKSANGRINYRETRFRFTFSVICVGKSYTHLRSLLRWTEQSLNSPQFDSQHTHAVSEMHERFEFRINEPNNQIMYEKPEKHKQNEI